MRLGRIAVLAALIVAAAEAAVGVAAPQSATIVQGDLGRKLDEYLSRLEALGYSGGLAVVKGGETVLRKGYGKADRELGIPMGPDAVFSLGSITKPFTAAAILRLHELGKLKTSDPIGRFFERVPQDKAGITLEHLLTHSSGLESDFSPTDCEPTTRESSSAGRGHRGQASNKSMQRTALRAAADAERQADRGEWTGV